MSHRSASVIGNALFVFYCAAVGVYLLVSPWSGAAGHARLPGAGFFRGFVSGLGLIHLAAGIADLRVLSRGLQVRPDGLSGKVGPLSGGELPRSGDEPG